MSRFKIVGEKPIYQGKRVNLFSQQVELPNGKIADWELVKHIGGAAILPVTDRGTILMVKQYRVSTDDVVLEIPAGVLDSRQEDPMDCAKRELEEETGYRSDNIKHLVHFYSSIGICNEVIHIYLARDLVKTAQNLDEDEFVEVYEYSLEQLMEMIQNGQIVDSKAITALLAYRCFEKE